MPNTERCNEPETGRRWRGSKANGSLSHASPTVSRLRRDGQRPRAASLAAVGATGSVSSSSFRLREPSRTPSEQQPARRPSSASASRTCSVPTWSCPRRLLLGPGPHALDARRRCLRHLHGRSLPDRTEPPRLQPVLNPDLAAGRSGRGSRRRTSSSRRAQVLVGRSGEEAFAGADDDRVDHQAELVHEVVLDQRLHELRLPWTTTSRSCRSLSFATSSATSPRARSCCSSRGSASRTRRTSASR